MLSGRSEGVKVDGPKSERSCDNGRSWVKIDGHPDDPAKSGWCKEIKKCKSGRSPNC